MVYKREFSKNNAAALKGIAIIMMLLHHLFRSEDLFKDYEISFYPFKEIFIIDMSNFFKICVSIFVFITGIGLSKSLENLSRKNGLGKKQVFGWTTDRIIKTLSGYWVIVILSFVICQIIDKRVQTVFFEDGIPYGIVQIIIEFSGLRRLIGTASFNAAWWYMSLAVLFIASVPVFTKLFKKFGYIPVLFSVFAIPRIIGWEYVNSSYISFLSPLLLGIIFAEKNLMVKIANMKLHKNIYVSKVLKLVSETALVVLAYTVYHQLPQKLFWEIRYGVIPVLLICWLYEFFIDLPILKQILAFLGEHSLNIFLVHEFIRSYYLKHYIYSFDHFGLVAVMLLASSLLVSVVVELFKKLIRYDKVIFKLRAFIGQKIQQN